jgi:phage portal protein BeeE
MPENQRLPFMVRVGLAIRAATGTLAGSGDTLTNILNTLGTRPQPPRRGTPEFLQFVNQSPLLRQVLYRIAESGTSLSWSLVAPRRGNRVAARTLEQLRSVNSLDRRRELKLLRKSNEVQDVQRHPLIDMLMRGSEFITGFSLRKLTFLHLDLTGEAAWLYERNAAGIPVEGLPIPPSWIAQPPTPDDPFYTLRYLNLQGKVPAADMLWIRDPDPANPYTRGVGGARALSDELETDEYAAKHTKGFFFNDATPRLLVMGPNVKNDDQMAGMEHKLLVNSQGYRKAWRPHFMRTPENTVIKELQVGFQSMQMVELREREKRFVREYFGIPPEILGDTGQSNRSTIDLADYIFGRHVIEPRCELIRLSLQQALVPLYDTKLLLEYENPVPEDREFRLKAMRMRPGTVKVDEWRELQGLEPLGAAAGGNNFVLNKADLVVTGLDPAQVGEDANEQAINKPDPQAKPGDGAAPSEDMPAN